MSKDTGGMVMDYFYVFGVAFLQVAFKTLNILSVVKKRYVFMFFVSIGISLSWIYGVLKVVEHPQAYTIPFCLGCACGVVFTTWAEQRLTRRKDEMEKY